MKQLLLLTTIASFSTSSFSQLNKNQFIVGGSIAYSSYKTTQYDDDKSKNINLELNSGVGYFVLNKLAVGADISLVYYKFQSLYGDQSQSKSSTIYFSPFVRYYAFAKDSKLNFFGKVEYNYGYSKSKYSNDTTFGETSRTTNNGFSYSVGPVFFINPNIALELSLSYIISNDEGGYKKINSFLTGLGFQIHLGNKKNKS